MNASCAQRENTMKTSSKRGQTLLEYVLLTGLIATVAILALRAIGIKNFKEEHKPSAPAPIANTTTHPPTTAGIDLEASWKLPTSGKWIVAATDEVPPAGLEGYKQDKVFILHLTLVPLSADNEAKRYHLLPGSNVAKALCDNRPAIITFSRTAGVDPLTGTSIHLEFTPITFSKGEYTDSYTN